MKKVLFLSNIQVPYRVSFFNELSKHCDLTVVYERSISSNRNASWTTSNTGSYKQVFLDGIKIGNESSFSFKILKYLFTDYDEIIIGCYSTPIGMFSNLIMRLFKIKFTINFDGEVFASDNSFKTKMKKFFIKGASKYLIAGECSAETLRKDINTTKVIQPFYFSSLKDEEIEANSKEKNDRKDYVIVIGQYFPYKGMDIAFDVAKNTPKINYKFIGMGNRTDLFKKELQSDKFDNIEVIPFLQKNDLIEEYKKCKAMLLPTRQECWGLVINEAASFGTPVVSTCGSGAAVEYLRGKYDKYLAIANDSVDLRNKLLNLINEPNLDDYSNYLKDKSKKYSIEQMVRSHIEFFEK